jgi:hypothetical protein
MVSIFADVVVVGAEVISHDLDINTCSIVELIELKQCTHFFFLHAGHESLSKYANPK